jgi:uncharacterized C2H2 Zn-finger protein
MVKALKTKHSDEHKPADKDDNAVKFIGYKCTKCDYTCKNKMMLSMHNKQMHKTYKCQMCNGTFEENQAFLVHKKTHQKKLDQIYKHTNNITHKCEECTDIFSVKHALRQHVNSVHNKEIRTMPKPAAENNDKSDVHIYLYICTKCDMTTEGQTNLTTHINSVHQQPRVDPPPTNPSSIHQGADKLNGCLTRQKNTPPDSRSIYFIL